LIITNYPFTSGDRQRDRAMNVGLFFEVRPAMRSDSLPDDIFGEFEAWETIQAIASGLESLGHTVYFIDSQDDPLQSLQKVRGKLDVVFNTSVGFGTRFREMMAAAICEAIRVRYTGSDPMTQALTANKHAAKLIATSIDVPTPRWRLIGDSRAARHAADIADRVILKPLYEGSSIGVSGPYDTADEVALAAALEAAIASYKQPMIVEEFIEGYEITCPVLGVPAAALPPLALILGDSTDLGTRIYDASTKADPNARCGWSADLPVDKGCMRKMQQSTLAIHEAFGCRDLSRTDYRVTKDGRFYMVDVNATPQVAPTSSIVVSAGLTGLDYPGFLGYVLEAAVLRA
jgi:D-alanine-D-alanine ligase